MAYDEKLAGRIRELVAGEPGLTEQKMLGGLGFMIRGEAGVCALTADDGASFVA